MFSWNTLLKTSGPDTWSPFILRQLSILPYQCNYDSVQSSSLTQKCASQPPTWGDLAHEVGAGDWGRSSPDMGRSWSGPFIFLQKMQTKGSSQSHWLEGSGAGDSRRGPSAQQHRGPLAQAQLWQVPIHTARGFFWATPFLSCFLPRFFSPVNFVVEFLPSSGGCRAFHTSVSILLAVTGVGRLNHYPGSSSNQRLRVLPQMPSHHAWFRRKATPEGCSLRPRGLLGCKATFFNQ